MFAIANILVFAIANIFISVEKDSAYDRASENSICLHDYGIYVAITRFKNIVFLKIIPFSQNFT